MPPPPPRKSTKPLVPAAAPAAAPTPPIPTPTVAPAINRSEVKGSGKPKAPTTPARAITQEDIARRAYEIYAGRGYAPGDQNADWLEAERQLKAGL